MSGTCYQLNIMQIQKTEQKTTDFLQIVNIFQKNCSGSEDPTHVRAGQMFSPSFFLFLDSVIKLNLFSLVWRIWKWNNTKKYVYKMLTSWRKCDYVFWNNSRKNESLSQRTTCKIGILCPYFTGKSFYSASDN